MRLSAIRRVSLAAALVLSFADAARAQNDGPEDAPKTDAPKDEAKPEEPKKAEQGLVENPPPASDTRSTGSEPSKRAEIAEPHTTSPAAPSL